MLTLATVLFAVAALGGLLMASGHFRGHTPPKPALAALHGVFAAAGLVVLLLAVINIGTGGAPTIALVLFALAALGGFFLLSFHLRGRPLPGGLIGAHGLLAVVAFLVLLGALLPFA